MAANTLDTVTVPRGCGWHVVARWGDPMWSDSVPFDQATRGSGASQERTFGGNNDGMSLFDVGAEFKRYGIGLKDWGYAWATTDQRFDISKHPNEPIRAGSVVEIDPRDRVSAR